MSGSHRTRSTSTLPRGRASPRPTSSRRSSTFSRSTRSSTTSDFRFRLTLAFTTLGKVEYPEQQNARCSKSSALLDRRPPSQSTSCLWATRTMARAGAGRARWWTNGTAWSTTLSPLPRTGTRSIFASTAGRWQRSTARPVRS
eukprot:426030-Pleurochrysis_carterae.AAC.2